MSTESITGGSPLSHFTPEQAQAHKDIDTAYTQLKNLMNAPGELDINKVRALQRQLPNKITQNNWAAFKGKIPMQIQRVKIEGEGPNAKATIVLRDPIAQSQAPDLDKLVAIDKDDPPLPFQKRELRLSPEQREQYGIREDMEVEAHVEVGMDTDNQPILQPMEVNVTNAKAADLKMFGQIFIMNLIFEGVLAPKSEEEEAKTTQEVGARTGVRSEGTSRKAGQPQLSKKAKKGGAQAAERRAKDDVGKAEEEITIAKRKADARKRRLDRREDRRLAKVNERRVDTENNQTKQKQGSKQEKVK